MFSASNHNAPDNMAQGQAHRDVLAAATTCVETAKTRNIPVLLRHVLPIDGADPWLFLPSDSRWWQAWHSGNSGMNFAAYGIAVRHEPSHFSETSKICSQLSEQVFLSGDFRGISTAPLALVGSAFDQRPSNGTAWAQWSPTSLVVPEVMIVRHTADARCQLVVNQLLDAQSDTEAVTARVATLLAEVQTHDHRSTGLPGTPSYEHEPNESQAAWAQRVRRAKTAISEHEFTKVVLARNERVSASNATFDPHATLFNLRRQHPGGYCFAISNGDSCFLGASPERLVAANNGTVITHALAGTVARGTTAAEDERLALSLLNSKKDRHEQNVVTQMLVGALDAVCTEVTHAAEPELVRLPHVQHLSTEITGSLRNGHHILELVERLHPTPAVCGSPVHEAQQWLAENEPMVRGWYSGPVGWVGQRGTGDFSVAIRSALMFPERTYAYAGAGIVAGSNPESEWRETGLKLQTILAALACREAEHEC